MSAISLSYNLHVVFIFKFFRPTVLYIPSSLKTVGSLKLKCIDGNNKTNRTLNNVTRINGKWHTTNRYQMGVCSETSEIANIMISHKSQNRKTAVEGSCFSWKLETMQSFIATTQYMVTVKLKWHEAFEVSTFLFY